MLVGVMAGTPVDTQMGVDYIKSKGYEAIGFACSKSAPEQNEMQILHKEELLQIAINGCLDMVAKGATGIYVYCNSLSGAIDMDKPFRKRANLLFGFHFCQNFYNRKNGDCNTDNK